MKVLILAPCYGPPGTERIADRLRSSARHFGYPDVCLYGLGRLSPGSPHGGDMQGTWVIEELKNNPSDADTVIACDASDVLFTGPMEDMLEKYRAFNSGFVIGSELADHGLTQEIRDGMLELHRQARGRFGNVNIGYWIGDRAYAAEVLQKSIDLYRGTSNLLDNPQAWLPCGMVYNTIQLTLDRNCVLFQPGGDEDSVRIENGRIHNTATDTWPCCMHYNGSGGTLTSYNRMYERLILKQ